MSVRHLWLLVVLPLLVLSLALSGCGSMVEKGVKPAPDWSRGVPVGASVEGSLGLAVEGAGERVHLVWPHSTEQRTRIRYLQLDQQAKPVVERDLELSSGRVAAPRLLPAGEGRLHLLWTDRPSGGGERGLWHVMLDSGGNLVSDGQRLSPDGVDVRGYDGAVCGSGGAIVAWDDAGSGGIQRLGLSTQGTVEFKPVAVAATGRSPTVRADSAGTVHLAWLEGTRFLYASLSEGDIGPVEGMQIGSVALGPGDNLVGPLLGLSEGQVYVFWSVRGRAHEMSGTAYTEFVAFPNGAPALSSAKRLDLSAQERQHYENYELARGVYSIHISGTRAEEPAYQLTQLVRPAPIWDKSEFVYQPHPVQGEQGALAVAVSSNQQMRQDRVIQVAVAFFEEGRLTGYQMACKTLHLSHAPTLAVDESGELHLAWREGAPVDSKVFYATTAPAARAALDRLTVDDIAQVLGRAGLESLASVLLFPVATPWILSGLAFLTIWVLLRERIGLGETRSWGVPAWVPFGVAVGLYQGVKLFLMPTLASHVPFSAWFYVPGNWASPLQVAVPVVILAVAGAVGALVRRHSRSIVLLYLSLVLTDMVLTLAVYGVSFFGES